MAGGQIKVSTDKVAAVANDIAVCNIRIRDAFSSVENAIKTLDAYWEGSASEKSKSNFYKIKDGYSNNRYASINNYVVFLRQQIDAGYVDTEAANKKLADAFK